MNDLCSMELLRNALSRNLSAEQEAALHAHLDDCESCNAQMEQLAGGEVWQRLAVSLLSADEFDAAARETVTWSDVDFGVEHLDPCDDANVLGQLGGYDVIAVIGRGGMGIVLKAFDRELKRFIAIKVLAPHMAHSSVARKRFAREAQAAAAVVHPHVIAIHHVQPTGRLPFLIMPLLTGESLAQRLKARGPLELTEVLRIGMQAAAGLAAAHDQGLVHRDVKPANILLEKGVERVVITDFGLARAADDVSMTRQGVVAGTPEYMSPEQARGEALDGRSDLFSLGCVLYEMATGVSPFRADSTMATLRRIVDERPAAIASLGPELPPWFIGIVERLLAKDPAQRFASANEVGDLLEACLSHLQQPATVALPASVVSQSNDHRFFATTRLLPGAIAMLCAFGLGLLGMFLCGQGAEPAVDPELRKTADAFLAAAFAGDVGEARKYAESQPHAAFWAVEIGEASTGAAPPVSTVHVHAKSPEQALVITDPVRLKTVPPTVKVPDGGTVLISDSDRRRSGVVVIVLNKNGACWQVRAMSFKSPESAETCVQAFKNTEHPPMRRLGKSEAMSIFSSWNISDAGVSTPGIRVKLRLNAERHTGEMLRKNVGFDRLSLMGSGIKGTIDGKASDNLVVVLAHHCRLESVDEAGKRHFEATFFVPQGPTSDGSNIHLSQKRLDEMQDQGVEFWLDHHRDQFPGKPESAPQAPQENKKELDSDP